MALPAHLAPDGEWNPTLEIGGATGAPEGLDPGGGGGGIGNATPQQYGREGAYS